MKVTSGIFAALLLDGKARGRKYLYKIDGVFYDGRHLHGVFRREIDGGGGWECIGYLSF